MKGFERAFVWAIAIALTVRFGAPEVLARYVLSDWVVVAGLAVLGLIAAVGYGYAHGGVVGSTLLGISALVAAIGIVPLAATVALFAPPAVPLGENLLWDLSVALVGGGFVGIFGDLVGRGIRHVVGVDRRPAATGTVDR